MILLAFTVGFILGALIVYVVDTRVVREFRGLDKG